MRKILIINIFGIGDVLFTTPLIRNIKKEYPDCSIGYVCNLRALPVLAGNDKLDKIFVYERDDYRRLYDVSKIQFFKKFKKTLEDIKKEKYDVCIDLSLNPYASFFMWLIGIPKRIGFNYKNRSPFLNKKVPLGGYEDKHIIEYYLDILDKLGTVASFKEMELPLKEVDFKFAENNLPDHQSDRNPLVAIMPGGGASWGKDAPYKRWPPEKYAKLADKLVEKYHAVIILLGDKNEEKLCSEVLKSMQKKALSFCGQTTVGQLGALLSKCRLAIVNDGGPLHIATAVGIRTVSIFGPVDEKVYGPYPQEGHFVVTHDVSCRPCYRNFRRASCDHMSCLNHIEVDDVLTRVQRILK